MLLALMRYQAFKGSDTHQDNLKHLKDNQKNVQKSPHLPY